MNVLNSSETRAVPEREYNQTVDLCPLEHILIGSSISPKDKTINLDVLKKDKGLARDEDFLLKPVGLTNGKRTIEDVIKGRVEKKRLKGWIACFEPTLELAMNYSFDFILNQPDSNNMIPNRFEFKFKKIDSESSVLSDEDINYFRKIELSEGIRDLFALTGDKSKGIFTITYLPVQEKQDK